MSAISPTSPTSPQELLNHDLHNMKKKKKESIVTDSTPDRKNSTSSEKFELTTSPVPLTPKDKQEQHFNLRSNSNESNSDISVPTSTDKESNSSVSVKLEQEKLITNKRTDFPHFQVGVSEDRNKRYRRTMEDAHSFFYDFAGIEGQGFFAIFDGHAGRQAAEWCGNHFHKTFQDVLRENPTLPIPEIFHLAFLQADKQLNQNAGKHSGCTAISAFLRSEDAPEVDVGDNNNNNSKEPTTHNGTDSKRKVKRVLYTANVGDARAVLSRNGRAVRLSYDHKGSDPQEAKRIVDAGGFVMNNRVNGVLAVTRSLGDSSMKEFVIGNPYTAETVLTENDPFLILACDGLWDVCDDQNAVDLIKDIKDPQEASETLIEHALQKFSTDNLSVMVVRFTNG